MKKFLVLYMAPIANLEAWMKTDPQTRKEAEAKMMGEWDAWVAAHAAFMTGTTAGAGKTKRVTKDGVTDVKNDVMLYSVIQAESHEAAAAIFEGHPHFGIPDAHIEVMEMNPIPETKP